MLSVATERPKCATSSEDKVEALQDLPPTPEQFKPKSPVSSIKVRKRKKRRGVHWGETSTRVVRTSYTRYFGD